jgi:ABC-type Na+ efflux pump permease subunit
MRRMRWEPISRRRVRAIVRKELRIYRRNRSMVTAMAIIPIVFLIQPLVSVFTLSSATATALSHRHELLYMLGIPALVPATLASYSVVGERQQSTLEPVLGTPIRRSELLLGKALAVLAPSIAVSYAVFALFVVLIELFAHAGVASAILRTPDVLAQIVFTPLIAGWSIWIAVAISTRSSDVRVAQQLASLASLPTIAFTTLTSLNVLHPTLHLALVFAIALLALNRVGWRVVSALFDRERLIASTKG